MVSAAGKDTEKKSTHRLLRISLFERGQRRTVAGTGKHTPHRHIIDFSQEHPSVLRQARRRAWQFWRR